MPILLTRKPAEFGDLIRLLAIRSSLGLLSQAAYTAEQFQGRRLLLGGNRRSMSPSNSAECSLFTLVRAASSLIGMDSSERLPSFNETTERRLRMKLLSRAAFLAAVLSLVSTIGSGAPAETLVTRSVHTIRPVLAAGFRDPDWQIHSRWCATDGGSSGGVYRSTCRTYDQFDSVIACQQDAHNDGAVQAVQAAGRTAVDSYMDNYKPKECK